MERDCCYEFMERVLKAQRYSRLSKTGKGLVRRFLSKVTGLSRAQTTRLIQRWIGSRQIERKPMRRPSFPRRYTAADIASLAVVDAAHEDLSGPAVRHLGSRAWNVFGNGKLERLAGTIELFQELARLRVHDRVAYIDTASIEFLARVLGVCVQAISLVASVILTRHLPCFARTAPAAANSSVYS